MLEELKPFAMSLLIGLVIGIERERRNPEGGDTMGVRSYTLIALLGTAAARTGSSHVAAALALVVGSLIVMGYWTMTARKAALPREAPRDMDIGLTSEFAAALVFAVGYMTLREPLVAGIVGLAIVTLLYSRRFLHEFSRNVLKASEIRAALTLAVFGFVIVPFLPNRTIDPWELLNPRKLGMIIAVIAGVEFFGYAVERYGGTRVGRLAAGFFGGLASSTAVFVNLPKLVREDPKMFRHCIGSGLMANAATLCFLAGILVVTSFDLALPVGAPALAGALVSAGLAFVVTRRSAAPATGTIDRRSPLDFRGAFKLGVFVFGLLAATAFAERNIGVQAVDAVSFFGGLFELHGVTIANATLYMTNKLDLRTAAFAIYWAISASFVSKVAISWALDRGRFAAFMTMALGLVYAAIVGVALIVLPMLGG